jgi:hypothetical protein
MPFRRCAVIAALLVVAAAPMRPATAFGEAGDECGAAAAPATGEVIVAAGTISCADAMAVVNRYLSDLALQPPGEVEWVRFDGWDCWTPSPGEKVVNGFGTECSRGMDNVQIRG